MWGVLYATRMEKKRQMFTFNLCDMSTFSEEKPSFSVFKVPQHQKSTNSTPYIMNYFTVSAPGVIRCIVCYNFKKLTEYATSKDYLENAENHLGREHQIYVPDQFKVAGKKGTTMSTDLMSGQLKGGDFQGEQHGYTEDLKKTSYRTNIFKYLTKIDDGNARCNFCYEQDKKEVSFYIKNSVYKKAEKHLEEVHGIVVERMHMKKYQPVQVKIGNYGEKQIIDLACRLGVPLRQLQNSIFFRSAFLATNFHRRDTPSNALLTQRKSIISRIKSDICMKKLKNEKFTLSLNQILMLSKKWLLIALYCQNNTYYSLGVIFLGKQVQMRVSVASKLYEFDVSFNDLICTVYHSLNQERKWVCQIGRNQILCLSLAVQMTLIRQLYQEYQDYSINYQFSLFRQNYEIDYLRQQLSEKPVQNLHQFKDASLNQSVYLVREMFHQFYCLLQSHKLDLKKTEFINTHNLRMDIPYKWRSLLSLLQRWNQFESIAAPLVQKFDRILNVQLQQKTELGQLLAILSLISSAIDDLNEQRNSLLCGFQTVKTLRTEVQKFNFPLANRLGEALWNIQIGLQQLHLLVAFKYLSDPNIELTAKEKCSLRGALLEAGTAQKDDVFTEADFQELDLGMVDDLLKEEIKVEMNPERKKVKLEGQSNQKDEAQALDKEMQEYEDYHNKGEFLKLTESRLKCIPTGVKSLRERWQHSVRIVEGQSRGLSRRLVEGLIMVGTNPQVSILIGRK